MFDQRSPLLAFALCLVSLVLASPLRAQNDSPAPTEAKPATEKKKAPPPTTTPAAPGDPQRPAFEFRDESGQPVLVPNITYRDIMEFFRWKRGYTDANPKPPAYVIQSIQVTGQVEGRVAEWSARFVVRLKAKADQPISIPLGLNDLVRPEAKYSDAKQHFLTMSKDGFVLWLQGPADSEHTLTLKGMTPLRPAAVGGAVSLRLPFAPTRLALTVPLPRAAADINGASRDVNTTAVGNNRTRIDYEGNGGQLEVQWRPEMVRDPGTPAVLFARSALTVDVQNPNLIRVTAALDVRSTGRELTRFEVRLPPGMRYVRRETVGYQVRPARTERLGSVQTQIVRVRLEKPAARAPSVRLTAELVRRRPQAKRPFEAWGFDVLGANQSGEITLIGHADWRVIPRDARGFQRVRADAEPGRDKTVVAKYQVVSQPCSLNVQVERKETRLQVTPRYTLEVLPERTELEMRISCSFGSGRPVDFDVDLGSWVLDSVTPADASPQDQQNRPANQNVTILLSNLEDSNGGTVEVVLRAHRARNAGNGELVAPLPRTEPNKFAAGAQLVRQPALLIAAAANNVEISPRKEAMPAWVERPLDAELLPASLSERQQTPFMYRAINGDAALQFQCDVMVRAQTISAEIDTTAEIETGALRVEQVLHLDVSYEPLSQLRLAAPQVVLDSDRFAVMLNNQILPITVTDLDASRKLATAELPTPILGPARVRIRFRLTLPRLTVDTAHLATIPTVSPAAAKLVVNRHTVKLTHNESISVSGPTEPQPWSSSGNVVRPQGRVEHTWTATTAANNLDVALRATAPISGRSIVVRRFWLQTWLTPQARHERAVYRFSTSNQRLAVLAPPGAILEDARFVVAVDGARVEDVRFDDKRRVEFSLPATTADERVLEIWFEYAPQGPGPQLQIVAPRLEGASRVEQFYWQLVTPARVHLLTDPAALNPEMLWEGVGWMWGRRPSLRQAELEQLLGATRRRVSPSATTNQYLFSSFGVPDQITVVTARRSVLVLVVASLVLLLGGIWMKLDSQHLPWFFLVMAVGIAAFSALYPVVAVTAAQIAALGLGLLIIAALTRWAVWRGYATQTLIRGVSVRDASPQRGAADPSPSEISTSTLPPTPVTDGGASP